MTEKISHFIKPASMLALAALLLSPVSCKKNDSDSTKNYLDGTLRLEGCPMYILSGSSFSFKVAGVSHPLSGNADVGHRLGFYYRISGIMDKADTVYKATVNPLPAYKMHAPVQVETFSTKDTLGTFQLTACVYPEDEALYYSSTRTVNVTTIDPDKSIPEIRYDEGRDNFTDERDYISYNIVKSDASGNAYGLKWMQQNLAYQGEYGELGRPYADNEDVNRLFGRFYTWEEAQTACPEGWRLPTDAEWAAMANTVNTSGNYKPSETFKEFSRHLKIDAHFNGQRLWEFWPEAPITSQSNLYVIPVGYCGNNSANDFKGFGEYAFFWTKDEDPDDSTRAIYRYCHYREDDFNIGSTDKNSMALSVRCVCDVTP